MALNKVGSGVGLFFELFSSALRVPGLSVRSGHLCSAFHSKLVLATPAGLVIPRFISHPPGATLQLRRGRGQILEPQHLLYFQFSKGTACLQTLYRALAMW